MHNSLGLVVLIAQSFESSNHLRKSKCSPNAQVSGRKVDKLIDCGVCPELGKEGRNVIERNGNNKESSNAVELDHTQVAPQEQVNFHTQITESKSFAIMKLEL